jgi:transposase
MLYVGFDVHRKQVTVSARDEQGNMQVQRQVSTRLEKIEAFFEQLHGLGDGQYVVILEVCGFEDWLVRRLLADAACRDVVRVRPDKRAKRKTDRRDAHQLSELLWVNRLRLLAGEKVQGVRRVYWPTEDEQQDRQLTSVRYRLGRQRTRTVNQIHHLLRKHNLEWQVPTKTFGTKKTRQWLRKLSLNETDRLELDQLLAQWEQWDRQIEQVEERLGERFERHPRARLLATIVGVSCYMALAIASRIGDVARFPRPRSLANFFGLTPGSRSSGQTERLGSITKEGSRIVRFLLGQLTVHVLRKDAKLRNWYKRIKLRRGAKIARVAVMRRLATIMWHMLRHGEAYVYGGVPQGTRRQSSPCDPSQAGAEAAVREMLAAVRRGAAADPQGKLNTGSSSLGSAGD